MVDTNVFIRFEKTGNPIDFSLWDASEDVYISVVIVSELLMGVFRANTEERRQRDLIIAATARSHDLALLTDNVQEFSRVPGLRVIPFVA
jgi:predicted nucleic acid-binding protein